MNTPENNETQKTLYLVRLRAAFRFDFVKEDQTPGVKIHTNQMQAAFGAYQAAQNFIQTNAPIGTNPFLVGSGFGFQVEHDDISMSHWDVDDDGFGDDGYVLESVRIDEDGGQVEEYGSASYSKTSFIAFVALCVQIGVIPPNLPTFDATVLLEGERAREAYVTKLLPAWWEDQKDAMTDEQKTIIWRTLHPRPYEIVMVPMEGTP